VDLTPEDYGRYCKALEDHLFRRAGGNIIKIVGPTFEMVCGWASRGIPVNVAQRGIDRYVERHAAKPRRHPVRIDFCEADVLDIFDEWRRAVGVPAAGPADAGATSVEGAGEGGRASLPSHVDRVIARLTAMRSSAERSLDELLDTVVRELDAARAGAKSMRGEARERFLERLRTLDAELLAAARARCDEATLRELEAEAAAQLAPFRERMPNDAYERSHAACIERGVRERFRLPSVAYDG
jgi:hypothetical protein